MPDRAPADRTSPRPKASAARRQADKVSPEPTTTIGRDVRESSAVANDIATKATAANTAFIKPKRPIPERIPSVETDVLSLNAFGDVICDTVVPTIRAAIVVGGVKSQLRAPRHGLALHQRGILYVPDHVANAGGLIDVAKKRLGYAPLRVLRSCEAIRHTTAQLRREAQLLSITPCALADRTAADRMSPAHCGPFRNSQRPAGDR